MKRTALAVLAALSLPAIAAADARPERRPDHFAPPPVAAPIRQDLALRRLADRYLEAAERPGERRRLAALEAEVTAALDRELAEARARLAVTRREPWARGARRGEKAEAWAQVERLVELRDQFGQLRGRFGRRAVDRKASLVRELVAVACLDDGAPGRSDGRGRPWSAVAVRDQR